jgi:hypothetical protein
LKTKRSCKQHVLGLQLIVIGAFGSTRLRFSFSSETGIVNSQFGSLCDERKKLEMNLFDLFLSFSPFFFSHLQKHNISRSLISLSDIDNISWHQQCAVHHSLLSVANDGTFQRHQLLETRSDTQGIVGLKVRKGGTQDDHHNQHDTDIELSDETMKWRT